MKVRPMGSFPYTRSFRKLAFAALACEERLRPEDGCSVYAKLALYRGFEYHGVRRSQPTNAGFQGRISSWLLTWFGAGIEEQKAARDQRSEEHTSELQSLMRISYAVFCLKKKKKKN